MGRESAHIRVQGDETAAEAYLGHALRNVYMQHVQVDEVWTFVRKKQGRLSEQEKRDDRSIGDQYLFLALDADSKLIPTYALGKRDNETTKRFIADLERRMVRPPGATGEDRPQISTDGFGAYPGNIGRAFAGSVRHGVLIKNYHDPESGRYAPPRLVNTDRINIQGIDDLASICTSHVERTNLTIRTLLKRFTRLALGFSKKRENLQAAVAAHLANYNFCWRLREPGKSGRKQPTPAMQAGVTDRLWQFDDLYDAVMGHQHDREMIEKYKRLAERLGTRKS